MAKPAKKVMVLGVDAPIVPRVHQWAVEGKLPTFKRLLDEGVYAPNCLVPLPTITPPNWTSIVTGAWPGTHGITDFDAHTPGTALDVTHKAFDSREVLSEAIWGAAERVGKRSIVMNYPTTWPSQLKEGWVIGGVGTMVNDWRLDVPMGLFSLSNLTHDILLSTEPYPFASEVTFEKAQGWAGVQHTAKALQAEVSLVMRRTLNKMEPVTWYLLVDASDGKSYDTVRVARSKRAEGVFATLRVGQWSPNVYDTFQTDKGPRKGVFRCKLVELSPDAAQFRLYVPGLCSLEGWADPKALEDEIKSEEGLPTARAGWETFLMEWIDAKTLVETVEFHHNWLVDASQYLFKNKPWDLYFIHIHTPDWMYHTISVDLDPATSSSAKRAEEYQRLELEMYRGVDRCLARLLEAADEETLVIVTSDHGAKAKNHDFHVEDILEAAGLLHYLPEEEGKPRRIDWGKTKAVGQRSVYVYLSVEGRDPNGIVKPGEEYAKVQDQVIKALYDYTDPETGLKPIAMALRKEDARIVGLYGDRVGDVIYAVDPRFGKEHGSFLPTAKVGIGDLRGLFIMKGPGVKQGETIQRTVWLTDIVPTVCHLAELPIPKDCEGAVLYQALADPDAKLKELQALRKNVDRLKRMLDRPPMC
jgi:predicted AlkP superfamily phosphohydrolase/phosphomutase